MFGHSYDYEGALGELVRQVKGLDGFETQIVLREFYEELSGIANLNDPKRPLALVGESPVDGNHLLWPLYNRIREFKLYEIHKHYGLSLTEFMELPRDIVEMILGDQREEAERQRNAARRAEQKLGSGDLPLNLDHKLL